MLWVIALNSLGPTTHHPIRAILLYYHLLALVLVLLASLQRCPRFFFGSSTYASGWAELMIITPTFGPTQEKHPGADRTLDCDRKTF